MKFIVVTPAVPHPFGDTAARWFYVLINELLARRHEVVALAATEESNERIAEARQRLAQHGDSLKLHIHRLHVDTVVLRRKWQSLWKPGSELLQDKEFSALVKYELAGGYDVLHLEQMSTGWLGEDVPRTLLNVHYFDALDRGGRAEMTLHERKALWQAQRATRHLLYAVENVRLLTPRLKEAAEEINPHGRYWVVPLALDPDLYPVARMVEDPVVGLIGSMHWEPSRSAAERLIQNIWPKVKQRVPDARLYIAGWNARKYLEKYSSQPDLTLEDNLAHPSQFFSRTAVMVYAPSQGSGMKVKVMESMAYGVPVVTTWEGMEGIEYQNGRECWVGADDDELAESIVRLLENTAERRAMREAARQLIEQRYSPRPVVDKMMTVYQQVIASSAARPSA